tara:strand:+ start:945 stop:1208 length:264 start_codon:yes stop_codon:yes gene_type:complete
MAPRKVAKPKRTAAYYRKNPKARAKKKAYDTKYHSTKKRKKYRADLQRERRKRGIAGKGGKDVSHKKGGGFTLESPSKNRARNRGKK